MASLQLVIGPVGAGKTTFVRQLCQEHRAVGFNLDAWMASLYGADTRPPIGVIEWYLERRDRCIEQIWSVARDLLELGTNVVLEIGLIQRDDRTAFYRRLDERADDVTIHVLDAARDVRRDRVEHRNRTLPDTFSMQVPPHIFELASDMWQPPDDDECQGRDVRFIFTDT